MTLVPELSRTLSASAPGMRIIARAIGRQNALDAIAAGELDVALGYFRDLSDAFIKDDLFQEAFSLSAIGPNTGWPEQLRLGPI